MVVVSRECAPHPAQGVFHLDISELLVGMCLDLLQQITLGWQDLLEGILEIRLGGRGVVACLHWSSGSLANAR